VKELESAAEGQKQEWDRIRRENSELREQVEAAELQISSISKQYRELLQTKEKEVSELKQQLHEKEDQHNKLLQQSPTRRDVMSPPSHFVVHHHHEDSPVTDLITAQIEINQLSKQTERLQAQVKHWKSVAQAKQSLEDNSRDLSLQSQLEDLRCQLTEKVDSHQSQLAALQNEHTKTLLLMRNEHELEVGEKESIIQELERQLAMETAKEQKQKDDKVLV
jgi:DNA repair exonuclease SbcCD ATPase subunit